MQPGIDNDTNALAAEILRYLAAVDSFRAAGCEPTWRPEVEVQGGVVTYPLGGPTGRSREGVAG